MFKQMLKFGKPPCVFFFLEYAGELHINALKRGKRPK